jgi:WD40 repeat protein
MNSFRYDIYSGGLGEDYHDNSGFNVNLPNDNPTRWIDYNSFLDDTGPISALTFHDSSELLWIGNQTGRLTSYLHSSSYEDSNFLKFSSFSAHTHSILQLLPISKHIISISSDAARMHSLGGLPVTQFKPDLTDYNGEIGELSCGTLFEPSGGLFRAESQRYLFLGSSHSFGYAYDLNVQETPLAIFDLEAPSLCVQSSVTFLTVGGLDGKIRFLDPSLRSSAVQHVIDAHSGGLSSFSVQSDGMSLISCGYQSRSINPYDVHSPIVVILSHSLSSSTHVPPSITPILLSKSLISACSDR